MNTKTLIGAVIGGVVLFLLGWLVYGILLADYMAPGYNAEIMLPMEEMNMGYILISNLLYGYFLALILSWSNSGSAMDGMIKAGTVGLITGISMAFSLMSMTSYYTSMSAAITEGISWAVLTGIAGAAIAWYNNRGK